MNNMAFARGVERVASVLALLLLLAVSAGSVQAAGGASLDDVRFSSLSGSRVQVVLSMSEPPPHPVSFTVDDPARIALDFPGVVNNLKRKSRAIGIGVARSMAAAEARDRTRVVINLAKLVPYETRVEGNEVFIILEAEGGGGSALHVANGPSGATTDAAESRVANVDFRRTPSGAGQVVIDLSRASIPADMGVEGDKIVIDFKGAALSSALERRLDVTDFATPVTAVDTFVRGDGVRLEIGVAGEYDHFAYQSDNTYIVEVKPLSVEQKAAAQKERLGFTGERLSLNFQDIEVRAVLQLIAEFTGLNMVVSDTVGGSVTLRLKNVPWDQALDIVLKTRGLGMRRNDNVVMVAPATEIANQERMALEAQSQVAELAPLHSEFIQVNFARASEIQSIIQSETASLLTSRGSVTVDERTNTLLVRETADNLEQIRRLVTQLDVPVRQVMIESRIVVADDNFSKDFGVRFGVTGLVQSNADNGMIATSGTSAGAGGMATTTVTQLPRSGSSSGEPVTIPSASNRYNVNLPVSSSAGSVAFAILAKNFLLDLELSAMQSEGRGEVISNPRVVTGNNQAATIAQGQTMTFVARGTDNSSALSVAANLSMTVTPQITPDDHVLMNLAITDDATGSVTPDVITVNNRNISTNVLVDDGETLVLGGIYQQTKSNGTTKVPLLGDIPVVGFLFKSTTNLDNKRELLVFVTPRILRDGAAVLR